MRTWRLGCKLVPGASGGATAAPSCRPPSTTAPAARAWSAAGRAAPGFPSSPAPRRPHAPPGPKCPNNPAASGAVTTRCDCTRSTSRRAAASARTSESRASHLRRASWACATTSTTCVRRLPENMGSASASVVSPRMKTVVVGRNSDIEAIIARRHALGIDRYDEIWEGDYHITPGPAGPRAVLDHALALFLGPKARAGGLVGTSAFNLGQPDDYRVPDGGYHFERPTGTWVSKAAVVIEIVSPDEETYGKFAFYARRANELIVVDPTRRAVECHVSDGQQLVPSEGSTLLGVSAQEIALALPWP